MQVAFPFHVDGRRRSAQATDDEHIRQMIEQVLFTSPGERVNRPDFGSGLRQLVFGPNTETLVPTVQSVVQGALQQWLGDRIRAEAVQVETDDNRLRITVQYTVLRNLDRQVAVFEEELAT